MIESIIVIKIVGCKVPEILHKSEVTVIYPAILSFPMCSNLTLGATTSDMIAHVTLLARYLFMKANESGADFQFLCIFYKEINLNALPRLRQNIGPYSWKHSPLRG